MESKFVKDECVGDEDFMPELEDDDEDYFRSFSREGAYGEKPIPSAFFASFDVHAYDAHCSDIIAKMRATPRVVEEDTCSAADFAMQFLVVKDPKSKENVVDVKTTTQTTPSLLGPKTHDCGGPVTKKEWQPVVCVTLADVVKTTSEEDPVVVCPYDEDVDAKLKEKDVTFYDEEVRNCLSDKHKCIVPGPDDKGASSTIAYYGPASVRNAVELDEAVDRIACLVKNRNFKANYYYEPILSETDRDSLHYILSRVNSPGSYPLCFYTANFGSTKSLYQVPHQLVCDAFEKRDLCLVPNPLPKLLDSCYQLYLITPAPYVAVLPNTVQDWLLESKKTEEEIFPLAVNKPNILNRFNIPPPTGKVASHIVGSSELPISLGNRWMIAAEIRGFHCRIKLLQQSYTFKRRKYRTVYIEASDGEVRTILVDVTIVQPSQLSLFDDRVFYGVVTKNADLYLLGLSDPLARITPFAAQRSLCMRFATICGFTIPNWLVLDEASVDTPSVQKILLSQHVWVVSERHPYTFVTQLNSLFGNRYLGNDIAKLVPRSDIIQFDHYYYFESINPLVVAEVDDRYNMNLKLSSTSSGFLAFLSKIHYFRRSFYVSKIPDDQHSFVEMLKFSYPYHVPLLTTMENYLALMKYRWWFINSKMEP